MPLLNVISGKVTGNEGKRDATKVMVHLNPYATETPRCTFAFGKLMAVREEQCRG